MQEARGGGLIVGRVFLSILFLHDGFWKLTNWPAAVDFMTAQGLPMVPLFLAISIAIEILAGAGLLVGFQTRICSFLLVLVLGVITLLFHSFWAAGSEMREFVAIEFFKNIAIMGGLLAFASAGPGPYSMDVRRAARAAQGG
ncbi:MAG: DoxX family protein [Myxococcota bacterium]